MAWQTVDVPYCELSKVQVNKCFERCKLAVEECNDEHFTAVLLGVLEPLGLAKEFSLYMLR